MNLSNLRVLRPFTHSLKISGFALSVIRAALRPMIFVLVLSLASLVTPANHVLAEEDDQIVAVRQALEWLAIIDDEDYSGSFSAMASIFTTGVREKIWQERISDVREPLGLVTSRLLESAEAKSDIQGAPIGEYMIVRFNTVFESDSPTTEAVTMYKQDDGSWKSVGYYVRKAEQ